MKNTSDLANFLRTSFNDPSYDLRSKYKLSQPVCIKVSEVLKCTRISNCLFYFQLEKSSFLISLCFNAEDIERIIDKKYSSLILQKKYNKIFYDIILH